MSAPHFFSNFFALVCSTICKETNIKNSGCHFSVFLQNSLFPVFHILGSFEQKSLKKGDNSGTVLLFYDQHKLGICQKFLLDK